MKRTCRHRFHPTSVKNIYGSWSLLVCCICGLCTQLRRN